jgi:hypothetical protein
MGVGVLIKQTLQVVHSNRSSLLQDFDQSHANSPINLQYLKHLFAIPIDMCCVTTVLTIQCVKNVFY